MEYQDRVLIGELRRSIDRLKAEVVSMRQTNQLSQNASSSILPPEYSGRLMAAIVGQEVGLPVVTQQRIIVPINISGEGPFIATGIHFAHKNYNEAQTPYFNWGNVYLLDFTWEYRVNNSFRNRQNIPVPQPIVVDAENGFGYMPLIPQDVFPRGATVEVSLNPEYAWPNINDRIWAGFSGYYSLEY